MNTAPHTQLEAWDQLQGSIENKRELVFYAISVAGKNGLTLFELVKLLNWPVNRVSGRVTELSQKGKIKTNNLTRINPESGKKGLVWFDSKVEM